MKTIHPAWVARAFVSIGIAAGTSGAVAADLATDRPSGRLETVATFEGAMPTGVTVSHRGRSFVCSPKWGDRVISTVAEVKDGRTGRNDSIGCTWRTIRLVAPIWAGPPHRPVERAARKLITRRTGSET